MSQDTYTHGTESGGTDSSQASQQWVAPKMTVAELEQSIEKRRGELKNTLEELVYQAQPKVQLELLTTDMRGHFRSALKDVSETFTAALQGDRKAIINVLGTTGAGLVLATLVIRRCRHRREQKAEIKRWRQFTRDLGRQDPPHNIEVSVR